MSSWFHDWTPEFKASLTRGFFIGLFTGLSVSLVAWTQTTEVREILIPGVTAFIAPLAARFAGEGSMDSHRGSVTRTRDRARRDARN